ncbi:NifU N-terminal domain-containing protein [Bacillaceae bacterium S4-13-58]
MSINVETTPNPNAMKFTSDSNFFEGDGSVSVMKGQTSDYTIMNELLALDGVDNVFGYQNFITVNKGFNADWDQLLPQIEAIFSKNE